MTDALIPPRSRLNPVAPLGIGTPDVESMASYICRVALSHCIRVSDLKRKVAASVGSAINPRTNWTDSNPSGLTYTAEAWSKALSELTGVGDLSALTLLPWRGVLPEAGPIARLARWCPECLAEDCSSGRVPYFRLAWHMNAVTACAKHETLLTQTCPECNRSETLNNTTLVIPGWCPKCGAFLGNTEGEKVATPEEKWIAVQIGDVLARQTSLEESPTREMLLDSIRSLISRLDGGEYARFARRIGLNKSTVHYWLRKDGLPSLPALLCIASRLGVDLFRLLTGDLPEIQSGKPEVSPRTRLITRRRRVAFSGRGEQVRTHLRALLDSNAQVSVAEAAKQLNVGKRQLYRSANAEARELAQRWLQAGRDRAQIRREIALKAIEEAYPKILADGKCVNLRQLLRFAPKNVFHGFRMNLLLEEARARMKLNESEPQISPE